MGKTTERLTGVKVLVCGGRDFNEHDRLFAAMDDMNAELGGITLVIHGAARGADRLAGEWAKSRGIHVAEVPALWDFYDRQAGPLRNAAMLTLGPVAVIAFPGGAGTAGMIRMASTSGIPIFQPLNRELERASRERLVQAGMDAEEEHGREDDDDGR